MLLLLFSFFVTLRGAPLLSPSISTSSIESETFLVLRDEPNERSTWSIVWSCLATIFTCTWSALHPNIPGPHDSGWRSMKRRFVTTYFALIAPEMLALWALKQYIGARAIMLDYNTNIAKKTGRQRLTLESIKKWFLSIPSKTNGKPEPWTMTHGFFVQMGGFLLCDGEIPTQVLNYARLKKSIDDGIIDPPDITAAEIRDRSKGDTISKAFVVLQTSWFVLQCIARWSENLPLSELEVLALGFATLNGITYALWLHKPQNIGKALRIVKKKSFQNSDSKPNTIDMQSEPDKNLTVVSVVERNSSYSEPPVAKRKFLQNVMQQDRDKLKGSRLGRIYLYIMFPFRLLHWTLYVISKMMFADCEVEDHALRVPMFATDALNDASYAVVLVVSCAIGALYGSVHPIAWSSLFPSPAERHLWRISAMYISAFPIAVFLLAMGFSVASGPESRFFQQKHRESVSGIIGIIYAIIWICTSLYGFARLALIVEALLSLRDLPPAVFQQVEWTMLIPHL